METEQHSIRLIVENPYSKNNQKYIATCSCGWSSKSFFGRHNAEDSGSHHLRESK